MRFRLPVALLLTVISLAAQNAGGQPVHYQVVYSRVYADDVEAGKTGNIGPGLQLIRSASVTTDPSLVISGKASIHMPPNRSSPRTRQPSTWPGIPCILSSFNITF